MSERMSDDHKVGIVALLCVTLLISWITFNMRSCSDMENAQLQGKLSATDAAKQECETKLKEARLLCGEKR